MVIAPSLRQIARLGKSRPLPPIANTVTKDDLNGFKGVRHMNGNLFLRTGVVLLVIGMGFGIYIGMTEQLTLGPVHAHLNLVGGVLMIVAGLFYNSRPGSALMVRIHYGLHLLGALLLPAGIYGMTTAAKWGTPVVGAGSLIAFLAILVFAINVFKGTGKASA